MSNPIQTLVTDVESDLSGAQTTVQNVTQAGSYLKWYMIGTASALALLIVLALQRQER